MPDYTGMPEHFAYLVSPARTTTYEQIENAMRDIWANRGSIADDNISVLPHVDFEGWGLYLAPWEDTGKFKWMEYGTPSNEEYHDIARAMRVVCRDPA